MDTFLGIISDTHVREGEKLPPIIKNLFKSAEGIIHAGDLTDISIIRELESIAPVWAVYGNMDSPETQKKLPEKQIIEWRGKRIGVVHRSRTITRDEPKDILPLFAHDNICCLIFGHSHKPYNKVHQGILCFNPGSSSGDYGYQPSIGLLYLEDDNLSGKIVSL